MKLRINGEPSTELLLFTSKLIFIPTLIAIYLNRWGDVVISGSQAAAALWFHSSHTPLSFYADQATMYLLAAHTLILATRHPMTPFLFVLGFGYMVVVYSYGKRNMCFCFDANPTVADAYHASIHILGIAIYSFSMICLLPYDAQGIFGLSVSS